MKQYLPVSIKKMDLSIIILSYNTQALTINCIDSILKSRPKMDYEIIVVDNNSTDGTVEILEKIRGQRVRVVLHKKNLGFSKGNNTGIKKARGRYIMLLNSDTIVTNGSIDALFAFAKRTPYLGIVGPQLLNADDTVQASVFHLPTLMSAIKQYWLGGPKIADKYYPKVDKPTEVEALVAACMLISPVALKKVGMLDERYFMYFEDMDYCRRVRHADLKIYYLPEAKIYHYHGQSGKDIKTADNQWRRLIPSSKIYHGKLMHYLIWFVTWSGQKFLGR